MRALAILLLVLAAQASAWPAAAASKWVQLQSPNFLFIGDAPERQIRQIAQKLEQFREVMVRALPGAASASPVPTVVVVFASDRSFAPFRPLHQGRPIDVAGYFVGSEDVNYIAVNAESDEFATRAIFHEYSHFLIGNSLGSVPVWMNEGLAQVYETFEERDGGKGAMLGLALQEHLDLLRSSAPLPLTELIAVDQSSPLYNEGSRRSLFYAQSWALAHYLTFGNTQRSPQFLDFLTRVRSGATSSSALQAAFGIEPATLEREVREYVRRRQFPAIRFTFEGRVTGQLAARGTELAQIEAEGYLGDLLARVDRIDDARALLRKVIAANPDAARATAALGLIELRSSRVDEALLLLERAAALAPANPMFATGVGRALVERLQQRSDGPQAPIIAEARRVLGAAADLAPDAAHTAALLGYVESVANEDPARAIMLLRKAAALAPAREEYRLMLGEALIRQRDYDGATDILGQLLARGGRADIKDQARRALARAADLRQRPAAGPASPRTERSPGGC